MLWTEADPADRARLDQLDLPGLLAVASDPTTPPALLSVCSRARCVRLPDEAAQVWAAVLGNAALTLDLLDDAVGENLGLDPIRWQSRPLLPEQGRALAENVAVALWSLAGEDWASSLRRTTIESLVQTPAVVARHGRAMVAAARAHRTAHPKSHAIARLRETAVAVGGEDLARSLGL